MYVGSTDWLAVLSLARGQGGNHPRLPSPPGYCIGRLYIKFLKNPSSTLFGAAKYTKCLNTTLAIMSTVLIILMCGIPIRWPTRGQRFWPGYLHSSPGHGTRTFGPVGSTRSETGFYELKNIRVGLVFMWANLMVQPCFATEVRGLARHSSGEREDSRGNKGIANKP